MKKELIEDKTKLEKSILELLKEFQEKYPKIIFEDINFVHKVERKQAKGDDLKWKKIII